MGDGVSSTRPGGSEVYCMLYWVETPLSPGSLYRIVQVIVYGDGGIVQVLVCSNGGIVQVLVCIKSVMVVLHR